MNMEKQVDSITQSRIDYCNGILGNIPLRVTNKLQRVQNTAARMIFKKPRRAHTTTLLKCLHWLPVTYRIRFKIMLLTFKSLNNLAPLYLKRLLNCYTPPRQLRSFCSLQDTLVVPRYRRKKHGGRSFSVIAPMLWNQLPVRIRRLKTLSAFKSQLKTFYFNQYFVQTNTTK